VECPQPDGNYVSDRSLALNPPNPNTPGPRRHRIWPWVVASIATVAGVALAGLFALSAVQLRETGPADQVRAFLEALEEGRVNAAYDQLCPDSQKIMDRDEFGALVSDPPPLLPATITALDFGDRDVKIATDIKLGGSPLLFTATKFDGTWRICEWRVSSSGVFAPMSP